MLVTEIELANLSGAAYDAALNDAGNLLSIDHRSLDNLRMNNKGKAVSKSVADLVAAKAQPDEEGNSCAATLSLASHAFWNTHISEVNENQAKLNQVLASLTQEQASMLDEVFLWVANEAKCEKDYDDNYRA